MRSIKDGWRHPWSIDRMDAISPPTPPDTWTTLGKPPLVALSSPLIYSLIVPFALADFWVSLYQAVCFPIYRVETVKRSAYFKFDRVNLPYLSALERFNCLYCSYVNGVIGFVREVAARTEQYWCPIKHEATPVDPHERYSGFSAFGDAADFGSRRREMRAELSAPRPERTITRAVRPTRR